MGSMAAAACELSESFGHDRSFGDSSLELQGLDSPDHRDEQAGNKASTAAAAAAARFSLEASYSSSSSSSASSSRSSSPADEPKQPPAVAAAVAEKQLQVPALPVPGVKAAGVDSLPAVR
jgi:hypothetical protein